MGKRKIVGPNRSAKNAVHETGSVPKKKQKTGHGLQFTPGQVKAINNRFAADPNLHIILKNSEQGIPYDVRRLENGRILANLEKELGKGAFGTVYMWQDINNPSDLYAVKHIKKDSNSKDDSDLEVSIENLQLLKKMEAMMEEAQRTAMSNLQIAERLEQSINRTIKDLRTSMAEKSAEILKEIASEIKQNNLDLARVKLDVESKTRFFKQKTKDVKSVQELTNKVKQAMGVYDEVATFNMVYKGVANYADKASMIIDQNKFSMIMPFLPGTNGGKWKEESKITQEQQKKSTAPQKSTAQHTLQNDGNEPSINISTKEEKSSEFAFMQYFTANISPELEKKRQQAERKYFLGDLQDEPLPSAQDLQNKIRENNKDGLNLVGTLQEKLNDFDPINFEVKEGFIDSITTDESASVVADVKKIDRIEQKNLLNDLLSLVRVAKNLCLEVQRANEGGVVLCDLKLENLNIDDDDNVWLLDFGRSKQLSGKKSIKDEHGIARGTLGFLTPLNRAVYAYKKLAYPNVLAAREILAIKSILEQNKAVPEALNEQLGASLEKIKDTAVWPPYIYSSETDAYALGVCLEELCTKAVNFTKEHYEYNTTSLPKVYETEITDSRIFLVNGFIDIAKGLRKQNPKDRIGADAAVHRLDELQQKIQYRIENQQKIKAALSATSVAESLKSMAFRGGSNVTAKAQRDETKKLWVETIVDMAGDLNPLIYAMKKTGKNKILITDKDSHTASIAIINQAREDERVQAQLPDNVPDGKQDEGLIRSQLLAVSALAAPDEPIDIGNCADRPKDALQIARIAEVLKISVKFDQATLKAVKIEKAIAASPMQPLLAMPPGAGMHIITPPPGL